MKYFSTFSGIGGFELGIKQAYDNRPNIRNGTKDIPEDMSDTQESQNRVTCIGFSEIDKYATQIYQKHFPNHKNYGDITKINTADIPDFDLLVGGFPCQTFSVAGKRAGFEDTRGTLIFDVVRILRDKRPRHFILENVKGLLSHDSGKTFTHILEILADSGYDISWSVHNSKNYGVPQNRERIFFIGYLRGTSRPQVFPFGEDVQPLITKGGRQASDAVVSRTLTATDAKMHLDGNYIQQLNNPTHSNDRVYGTDGVSPTLNTMQGGNRQPFVRVPEATKKGYAEAVEGDSINLSVPNSKTRRGRVGKGVAQTLDTGMQHHALQRGSIRRLTTVECARLQGFPDNWHDGLSDTQAYKCYGNAVTVNVIKAIMETIKTTL